MPANLAAHARTRKAATRLSEALEVGYCFKFILINSYVKPPSYVYAQMLMLNESVVFTWLLGLVV